MDTGATLPVTHCPRCGCDIEHYATVVPTHEQKYAYLAMLLGGPEARFRQDVPIFGGAITLTFRSLTAADGRLAFEQLRVDHLRTPIAGDLAFLGRLTEYRMALSLDRVAFQGAGSTRIPVATTTDEEPAGATDVPLPEIVNWLRDEVLVSESLTRTTLEAFKEFQRLVEALEEKADDPDFWKGIAARR